MLTVGQELYQLTARDRNTLAIEPYFRTVSGSILAGSGAATAFFPGVPPDRALFVACITCLVSPGVGQTVDMIELDAAQVNNGLSTITHPILVLKGPLHGDNAAPVVANQTICVSRNLGLILPPGAAPLLFVQKSNIANVGSYNCSLTGFLIPPGQIGRTF